MPKCPETDQVKRLLKVGGRFICLTLAESHVLGNQNLSWHIYAFWLLMIQPIPVTVIHCSRMIILLLNHSLVRFTLPKVSVWVEDGDSSHCSETI